MDELKTSQAKIKARTKEMEAAIGSLVKQAENLQGQARKRLNEAVTELRSRQKLALGKMAEMRRGGIESVERSVAATQTALAAFDKTISEISAQLEEQRKAIQARAEAIRAEVTALRESGMRQMGQQMRIGEKVLADFETLISKTADTLNSEVQTFVARADTQLKSWHATVDEYSKTAMNMAERGRKDFATVVSDLMVWQKNAQKQYQEFSAASIGAWQDIAEELERGWGKVSKLGKRVSGRGGK